jgi:dUTP pyrophosphatase
MLNIKIINRSNNPLPQYQTSGSAGMDLHANLSESIQLKPGERKLIPTGLFIQIPIGFEAQVRPRSGLALKYGVTVLNAPGTIDSDFRGEIQVLLINHSEIDFVVQHGERIAQMVVAPYQQVNWLETNELSVTHRGESGYGSSGV